MSDTLRMPMPNAACEKGTSRKPTGSQDDGTVRLVLLSLVLVLAADNLVAVADEVTDVGTLEELDAVGVRLGEIFELLHEGVRNSHACPIVPPW